MMEKYVNILCSTVCKHINDKKRKKEKKCEFYLDFTEHLN